jgi:predicted hydrocarbon binding protein
MHGTIFSEFQKYVEKHLGGEEAWRSLLRETGIQRESYQPLEEYPDDEAIVLIATAARKAEKDVRTLLQDFGEFIAPSLLDMYWAVIDPDWKALDVIEHSEDAIHRVVRLKDPKARPPYLRTKRPTDQEVIITYTSPRRMCALAKGIAYGIAKHYGERIAVKDKKCMHLGDRTCVLSVRRLD